jgi:DNA excision repair protein ERCC-2
MEKTLAELKFVMEQRSKDFAHGKEELKKGDEDGQNLTQESPILAMCLSSRKNLCIHETVSQFDEREKVDSECRARTASWVREKRQTVSEQMQFQSDAKIMQ